MRKSNATSLSKAFLTYVVPNGSVAIAWLGQAGFVLKSPMGHLLALDPYLSNSCKAIGESIGVNMDRMISPPIAPHDLIKCDALVFTHSHQDHVDPETVKPYLEAGGQSSIIASHEAADRLLSLGVPPEKITATWPNCTHKVGDFSLRATFAIPFGGDDLNHVGYLIETIGGPRIYFTGDTDYNEILSLSVAPYQPDIMITVINSAFRNLSPAQAARLAKAISPRWLIPCHHDLFPDNSLPDRLLRSNLALYGIEASFCPLPHGEFRIFKSRKRRRTLI